ncbi:MAG: peptidylprolyl isomerase [bacterium]
MNYGKAIVTVGISVLASLGLAFANPVEVVKNAPESSWRSVDPENLLYMDLPSGRVTIELRPDFAPLHVERIKTLTRQGFYNGVTFHRVIEGFMAQGGDPTGTGKGGSNLPDIKAEFVRDGTQVTDFNVLGHDSRASQAGFIGPIPTGAQPKSLSDFLVKDGIALWGLHCPGVMSMARADNPNSANSQFFLMLGDARDNLDQRYTIWGKIVNGTNEPRRISRGEPPVRPTPIVRMRVAADVPLEERDDILIMRTDSPEFKQYVSELNKVSEDGYIEDICSIRIPVKVNGEIKF